MLFKIGLKNVKLDEMAEAEALFSGTDQIQREMISETIEILLFYEVFNVKRKEKSTTM